MFCSKCGAQVPDGAVFCHKCGEKVVQEGSTPASPAPEAQKPSKPPKAPGNRPKGKKLLLGGAAAAVVVVTALALAGQGDKTPPASQGSDKTLDSTLASAVGASSPGGPSASGSSGSEADTAPEERVVLFRGIPVGDILGAPYDVVFGWFGQPDRWEEDFYYSDVTFFTEDYQNLAVDSFSSENPADFTYNGQSLKLDYDTMIATLGEDYEPMGGTTYMWDAAWTFSNYKLIFHFPRETSPEGPEDLTAMTVDVTPVGDLWGVPDSELFYEFEGCEIYGELDYEAEYLYPTYAGMKRYPEDFTGCQVRLDNLEVIQVLSSGLVSCQAKGDYDTQFIIDPGDTGARVLEGDVITVFGTAKELITMITAINGVRHEEPQILAHAIVMVEMVY